MKIFSILLLVHIIAKQCLDTYSYLVFKLTSFQALEYLKEY